MTYTTYPQPKNYQAYDWLGQDASVAAAIGSSSYGAIGWQGQKYVSIGGLSATDKLAKQVLEQRGIDSKTLAVGDIWNFGEGWALRANNIDVGGNWVSLQLFKDSSLKKEAIVYINTGVLGDRVFVYKTALGGYADYPEFVVYVDSISGSQVVLKYAFLVSDNVVSIALDDTYGVFNVTSVGATLRLNNSATVTLSQNSVVTLMGDLKIRVADVYDLRYYPYVLMTAPGDYQVRGTIVLVSGTSDYTEHNWTPQNMGAFFFDIKDNFGKETLTIYEVNNRDIAKDKMTYTTSPQAKNYTVYKWVGPYDPTVAAAIGSSDYAVIGWQGQKYVSIGGTIFSGKLAKIVFDQKYTDSKTLATGDIWNFGEGWSLKVNNIDAGGNWVSLQLFKDSALKKEATIYTNTGVLGDRVFVYKATLGGYANYPEFVVYVDSISGSQVVLKYAFLVSDMVISISPSDTFGVFQVKSVGSTLWLNNSATITLIQNSDVTLMGDLKIKVADVSDLRYYPYVTYTIPPLAELRVRKDFTVYSRSDSLSSGGYAQLPIINIRTFNTDDPSNTVLGELKYTVQASNIFDYGGDNYGYWYGGLYGNNVNWSASTDHIRRSLE